MALEPRDLLAMVDRHQVGGGDVEVLGAGGEEHRHVPQEEDGLGEEQVAVVLQHLSVQARLNLPLLVPHPAEGVGGGEV